MTIELTSLTQGTNEHARFLVTVGTVAEWLNVATDVGAATGDRDLSPDGPEIGRIRWNGTRWVVNRAPGETGLFTTYETTWDGNVLFLGYEDSQGVTQVLSSPEFSTVSWVARSGFLRWDLSDTDAVSVLNAVSVDDVLLVVFALAGSVAVTPPDPPDPPEPPDPDPDPPDPFVPVVVPGRRYERVFQSDGDAPVFFENDSQRVLLDLGVRLVREISVWLDSGRDSRFLTNLHSGYCRI